MDARTEITTELLSEEGFVVSFTDDAGEDQQEAYKQREFEKRFFADATNQLFCKTFLENALRDPVSGEIGKSIIFAVSQNHAAKLAQILNEMADRMFPGKYQSDFAVQVTSQIPDAQQFTINFTNNNLLGSGNFLPAYKTSKARVCVTVGMMTTGYDCTGHPQPRSLPAHLLAHRLHPDQGTRHPQARLPRAALRRQPQGRRAAAAEDRLQALRLLRQLRILREGVQLRRSAEASPPAEQGPRRQVAAPGPWSIGGTYEHLGADILSIDQGGDHRLRGHEDRPHVLREVRGHACARTRSSRQPSRPGSGTASSTT